MNGVKDFIPELAAIGMTAKDCFCQSIDRLNIEISLLSRHYSTPNIEDIKAYSLHSSRRIVKMAESLFFVIEKNNDFVSANILIRSIADSLATLILIYEESNGEVSILRHYLYIIDGLRNRIRYLPDSYSSNSKITTEEAKALASQIRNAKMNYKELSNISVNEIKRLSLYDDYSNTIDKYIKNGLWMFKNITSATEKYQWKEMYSFLGSAPSTSNYYSSLSDFVHGLSSSNLIFENGESIFNIMYCISSVLLDRLHEHLCKTFVHEMKGIRFQ